jgi:hypothetical protein
LGTRRHFSLLVVAIQPNARRDAAQVVDINQVVHRACAISARQERKSEKYIRHWQGGGNPPTLTIPQQATACRDDVALASLDVGWIATPEHCHGGEDPTSRHDDMITRLPLPRRVDAGVNLASAPVTKGSEGAIQSLVWAIEANAKTGNIIAEHHALLALEYLQGKMPDESPSTPSELSHDWTRHDVRLLKIR